MNMRIGIERQSSKVNHGSFLQIPLRASVRKHKNVVAIAKSLEDGLTKKETPIPLLQLDTQNRPDKFKEQMAVGPIRLVVRLMLIVDIGPVADTCIQSRAYLEWQDQGLNLKKPLGSTS